MTDDRANRLLATATPWIDEQLATHGLRRTGPLGEPRVRAWSIVVSITTDGGRVWFKAPSRVTAHEIPLYPLLAEAGPDIVLQPLGISVERSWILLPDGGTSLMHALSGDALFERLLDVLPRYAHLQRAITARVPAMLTMGVPDMRPATLPERFDEALEAAISLARDRGDDEDVLTLANVRSRRPRFLDWCQALAASPVVPSIDHSDLHANNMLLPEEIPGPARIYDWGDSVLAHPFSTLLVALRSLMDQLETTGDDPRLARARDAYLEPFTDMASLRELLELVDAACWTSIITRALNWVHVFELGPPTNSDWAEAPIAWMKTLLHDSWLD